MVKQLCFGFELGDRAPPGSDCRNSNPDLPDQNPGFVPGIGVDRLGFMMCVSCTNQKVTFLIPTPISLQNTPLEGQYRPQCTLRFK